MSRWFRLYDRLLDDPKAQRLAPDVFKGWINLLCLASRNAGKLPSIPDIAFALRITDREADSLLQVLHAAGLLEDSVDATRPHKWDELQFVSDQDLTAVERKRRQRDREKASENVTRDGHGKSRVQTRTEQTTEQISAARDPLKSFPRHGSVSYGPWGDLIRKYASGRDADIVADDFRKWCRGKPKPIPFDLPGIENTLIGFCKSLKQRTAA